MFSTGFPPHMLQNLIRKMKAFASSKTFCSVFRHVALEKCDDDQVCLCNSLAIRQLSKKAVTVVHFEILAKVPNQTWTSHVKSVVCGKLSFNSLEGSHWGVSVWVYDEYLCVTGCDIYAKSMLHQCDDYVTSMWHPCEKSDILATLIRHWCDTHIFIPSMNCAAEEDFIPLCYFNYDNNAFHLYFLYCEFYIIQTNIFH